MATLFLMVGLPGAGKTTLAKKMESEQQVLRLTPDEWIDTLYGKDLPRDELDAVRQPIEDMAWIIAEKSLCKGLDVILDFGFWGKSEREDYRDRAAKLGAVTQIVYAEASWDELTARLEKRNSDLQDGEFYVGIEEARRNWEIFQPPSAEELAW